MNNSDLLFYIIVPVFMAEKYIENCVRSVWEQTYTNWELILVDDGSPDNSGVLCDKLADDHKKIHVIHQMNKGQIAARMAGKDLVLKNLKNNSYVIHVDSDDTLQPNALKILKKYIEDDGSDIIVYRWQRIKNGEVVVDSHDKKNFTGILTSKKDIYHLVFSDPNYNSMCLKCISTELLDHENYKKFYGIRHGEDLIQSIKYYKDCNKITFTNEILYNYTCNESSVTQSVNYTNFSLDTTVRSIVWEFLNKENVFNKDDFSLYANKMQKLLIKDILLVASFPILNNKKIDLFNDIHSDMYYNTILSYSPCSPIIFLFKHRFYRSILILTKIRRFLSKAYNTLIK